MHRAAQTAFYAKTEAAFFLLLILPSAREHQAAQALGLARQLATEFSDNKYLLGSGFPSRIRHYMLWWCRALAVVRLLGLAPGPTYAAG